MASAALAALVEAHAPRRPYCGDDKHFARIRPKSTALGERYIQLNPPAHQAWLILDIDRPRAASAWDDAGLPPPTYVAINPENGRPHIGYALSSPVCTTDAARLAPMRYLAAIERAYTAQVRADFAFAGPMAKNPLHPFWRLWEPANAPTYELSTLAEFADLSTRPAPTPEGVGRNCELFDKLRVWAYRAVREFWRPDGQGIWAEAVRRQAEALNSFPVRLSNAEVAGIARSVSRYVWRRFSPADFRELQAERGRRGAEAVAALKRDRREQDIQDAISRLSVEGWKPSMRTVAKALDCSVSTLSEGYGHLWT
ncbi:replication initiation protein [Chromobacterium haemolyticum]|uniref:replication initiation protein n=1 Tax=Chromobacterium haemolyticum TaxID=394935 RepID=UPI0040554018